MKAIVYSKVGCPYCDKVERILEALKIEHTILYLGRDYDREFFIEKFSNATTFPQVYIDNKYVGGAKETVNFLREKKVV